MTKILTKQEAERLKKIKAAVFKVNAERKKKIKDRIEDLKEKDCA